MNLHTFNARLLLALSLSTKGFALEASGVTLKPNAADDELSGTCHLEVTHRASSSRTVRLEAFTFRDGLDGYCRLVVMVRLEGRVVVDWELCEEPGGMTWAERVEWVTSALVSVVERVWLDAELRDAAARELAELTRVGVGVDARARRRRVKAGAA